MEEVKKGYIQDYFSIMYNRFISKDQTSTTVLAKDTISKILGKPIDDVTEIEIQLLEHLYYNGTMSTKGNNITDDTYRFRLKNLYKYLESGMTLDSALDSCAVDPDQKYVSVKIETEQVKDTSKEDAFKAKYPQLFDEKGQMKPETYDLLDLLLAKHDAEKITQEQREEGFTPSHP